MNAIPLTDIAALAWFVCLWGGYTLYADRIQREGRTLPHVMELKREQWMRRMLARDNRIVDTQIMAAIMRSVALFASTTLFILAGLLAILGSVEKAQALFVDLPFVEVGTRVQWELKILLLVVIFVYAFFKFAWSVRQLNYTSVLIGAAPPPEEADTDEAKTFARVAARVSSVSVRNFNRGLRAYYFGLATLSWFLHPVLFAAATVWVVAIMYRREFRSHTLEMMEQVPDL